jgi:uncharacterized membrane protein
METRNVQQETPPHVPYPSIPALIDSRETEYRGTGVTSSVSILGHPIHPIIVIFPIGALSFAAGTDFGYWLTNDVFWARASIWLLGVGLLSGLAAGIVGMWDFFHIPRVRNRRAGWVHMLVNITALVLTTINFLLRWASLTGIILPIGLLLSSVVSILLLVSGWYGGELMFRHKVGIVGSDETYVPR